MGDPLLVTSQDSLRFVKDEYTFCRHCGGRLYTDHIGGQDITIHPCCAVWAPEECPGCRHARIEALRRLRGPRRPSSGKRKGQTTLF